MEKVELPIHKHPLLPFTRFSRDKCKVCGSYGYIYGGYRCNEFGCPEYVYHKACAESLPEINHSSHPDHPLKLLPSDEESACSQCRLMFKDGYNYICSICDFKLDLCCAKGSDPLLVLENSNLHEHPLELFVVKNSTLPFRSCKTCEFPVLENDLCYECHSCEYVIHTECAKFFPEANHTSHPQHPLKLLTFEAAPAYADMMCLLCGVKFDQLHKRLHHCDVCNVSICRPCMKNPPPVHVESPRTHEHQLHLVPRCISFTCNACGTQGDRSPYFCLQCNLMIHRQCIDLPHVININLHDHRISYTRRLGHGEWKCKVCRKKVDGFYGAYTCVKCPSFAVHSLCATREDVWDMRELEGMPEEEDNAPFEVIDDNTIKHFSHDHNLQINKDGNGRILPENIVCEACLLQILSEPFYSCEQCNFILHEKCANHPRKKRHVCDNQPFTLVIDTHDKFDPCWLCNQHFTGFRYATPCITIDVRCAAVSDTLEHGSHQHPLYYCGTFDYKPCSRCGNEDVCFFRCDECDYILDGKCALFPTKVMKNRRLLIYQAGISNKLKRRSGIEHLCL
ncbi:Zinc finger PHD-type [Arabidopsis thaliana x Arabidopsis arenosa]|uniref:Zinc finger PHD-type n=1 Tax=Arabidopsis thaliana x Arabidopsis arenosa TaxID=1240361 RepID=A0A8T2B073_9BRAS|nr:Zinc finger PHD-type [Arabidopsis thaliana x Arabidopsis arenosa]